MRPSTGVARPGCRLIASFRKQTLELTTIRSRRSAAYPGYGVHFGGNAGTLFIYTLPCGLAPKRRGGSRKITNRTYGVERGKIETNEKFNTAPLPGNVNTTKLGRLLKRKRACFIKILKCPTLNMS